MTKCDAGSQHKDSTHSLFDVSAAEADATDAVAATDDVSDHVLVKVSNIPSDLSEERVQMVFENKRYGGGDIKTWEFCRSDKTAVIEFESSAGNTIICSLLNTIFRFM